VETIVVDDEDRPVPAGEVGEIVHRSPHAALGYYHDEQKTAEAFRGGWFHSGDLGVMSEDGCLTVVDRKKDVIKTGGENVASRRSRRRSTSSTGWPRWRCSASATRTGSRP
jgi:fatty-acyl-CoA synthase